MYISSENSFDMIGDISFTWNKSNYLPTHCHTYWECFIIMDGEAIHVIDDNKHHISKNTFWLIKPYQYHALKKYKNRKFSRLNIMATLNETKRLCQSLGADVYDALLNHNGLLTIALSDNEMQDFSANATKHMTLTSSHNYGKQLLRMLFLRVIMKAYDAFVATENKYPEWLNTFIAHMSTEEYLPKKINELTNISNYSYSHLSKLFKFYTGKTLLEYFKNVKLTYACELLKKTDYSCADIAEKIGYSSISHFTFAFTHEFGMNPQTYRGLK